MVASYISVLYGTSPYVFMYIHHIVKSFDIESNIILPLKRYDKSSHVIYHISHGGHILVV